MLFAIIHIESHERRRDERIISNNNCFIKTDGIQTVQNMCSQYTSRIRFQRNRLGRINFDLCFLLLSVVELSVQLMNRGEKAPRYFEEAQKDIQNGFSGENSTTISGTSISTKTKGI